MASLSQTQRDRLPVVGSDSVAAAIQGAHVYAWQPARAVKPVLFLSPRSQFQPGKAIRGGVPLCFPWFGPHATDVQAPQHGFARTLPWTLERAEAGTDGAAEIVFQLEASAATRAWWPHGFAARYTIRADATLRLALDVRNTDSAPLTFGAALHTYLAVSDVRHIALSGLEHTGYLDKVGGRSVARREGDSAITFTGETDRVYLDTTATCVVHDAAWRRRIHVAKTGSRSTVVWNPWTDKARAMADLGEDAWPGFLCVETCNAGDDTVTLAPGATHTLGAEIRIEPL